MAARLACALIVGVVATLAAQALAPNKGKRFALLVGVREYDHRKLTELRYTENDAEGAAAALKVAGFEVVVLTTSVGAKDARFKPTKANIDRELKLLLGKKTKHDTVLIGLAGHGVQYEVKADKGTKRDESFFCPGDSDLIDSDDFDKLSATMLSFRGLFKQLDDSGAGVRLLLVDACRNDVTAGRNADTDAMPRPGKGVAALFSCRGGERAFETDKLKHGIFFHHVIAGLKGEAKNKKGEVTWTWLADYVIEKVSEDVPKLVGGGARQTPHLIANIEGRSPLLLQVAAEKVGSVIIKAAKSEADFKGTVAEQLYHEGREAYIQRGDLPRALRRFRQAEDLGHPLAQWWVGSMTCMGQGTHSPKNETDGVPLLKAALPDIESWAAKGNTEAISFLGGAYLRGWGVSKDAGKGIRLLRQAATEGHGFSMFLMGNRYRHGDGVDKNSDLATDWYLKAVKEKIPGAMNSLGVISYLGEGSSKQDYKAALGWFRQAADRGNAAAMNHLGNMYVDGHGTAKDYYAAARWYRQAADRDHAEAIAHLSVLHENGWGGLKKNEQESMRLCRLSVSMGDPFGMVILGNRYAEGRGVKQDRAEAIRLHTRAAELGNAWAKEILKKQKGKKK